MQVDITTNWTWLTCMHIAEAKDISIFSHNTGKIVLSFFNSIIFGVFYLL